MDSVLGEAVSEPRLNAGLFTAFAAVALLLSAIGVYGVTAYAAQQRTHELAVRAALGATGSTLYGLVTREALVVAVIGVVIGLAGAWVVRGVLTTLLYGIEPTNAWVFASGSGMMLVLALAASCRPAWRASRVDPVAVLRAE